MAACAWDGSNILTKKCVYASDTHYVYVDKKKIKGVTLWKTQSHHNEESREEENTTMKDAVVKN